MGSRLGRFPGARTWYGFLQAFPPSCLAHPIRRCRDLLLLGRGAARRFPQAILDLLLDSLDLRDRHPLGWVSEHGLAVATGRLQARLDRLLAKRLRHPAHQRLARHLLPEQPHLFTFRYGPGDAGHPHYSGGSDWSQGSGPQDLGWQPNLEGCAHSTNSVERFANLRAATQRRLSAVDHTTPFPAAGSA